jgi:uncharacterized protein (DUF58 family)
VTAPGHDDTSRTTQVWSDVVWRPAPLARRLLTMAGLALICAVWVRESALVSFATPALVAVALWLRGPRPDQAHLRAETERARTFEGAAVPLRVRAETSGAAAGGFRLTLRPGPHTAVAGDAVGTTLDSQATMTWQVRPALWGWWSPGTVTVRLVSPHRAWVGEATLRAPELTVFPPVSALRDVPPPPQLRARLGAHVARAAGAGIEFAALRDYQPSDPVRRVNWVRSSTRGALLVNEYAQERMADVVIMIDAIRDVGRRGESTVDRSVRGAVGVVQAYLGIADRVGVVAFGSSLRWLTPTTGVRHFYRVVEVLLEARQTRTYVDPSLDRLPSSVLPSGALVVCFTPLLDELVIEAIRDLRERAHPVVVVDVLSAENQQLRGGLDVLAMRIWRLEREAIASSLTSLGASVIPYAVVTGGSSEWLQRPASGAGSGVGGPR